MKITQSLLIIQIALIVFSSCEQSNNGYKINGNITNAQALTKVYLQNERTGVLEDSTSIDDDGNFYFEGVVTYPQKYKIIYQSEDNKQQHTLWVENTAIEITGQLSKIGDVKIKAGKEQKLEEEMLQAWNKFFYAEHERLSNEKKYDSIGVLINEAAKIPLAISIKHPDSYMAIQTMYLNRKGLSKDSLRNILQGFNEEILNSDYGKSLSLYVNSPNLGVGERYVDFSGNTIEGTEVQISKILEKEKPILLIFGGLDCMEDHGRKMLKAFHDQYQNDVEILVFSTAGRKATFLRELEYDLAVPLITDLKGDHSPIKIQYDIVATPTIYIIDKNGLITWRSEGYTQAVNEAALTLIDS